MNKFSIFLIFLFLILYSCNEGFKHNPSEPYPILEKGEYWVEKFDQRGLQHAEIMDDKLFVNTINISKGKNFLYCLNLSTGKVEWKAEVENHSIQSVILGEKNLYYIGYLGQVSSIDYDGKLIWIKKHSDPTSLCKINSNNGNLILGTVANGFYELDKYDGKVINHFARSRGSTLPIINDNQIIFSSHNYKKNNSEDLVCLSYNLKDTIWDTKLNKGVRELKTYDNKIFAYSTIDGITCLNETNGEIIWNRKKDGYAEYFGSHQDLIYYSSKGKLTFLDPNTGKEIEYNFKAKEKIYTVRNTQNQFKIKVVENINNRTKYKITIEKN